MINPQQLGDVELGHLPTPEDIGLQIVGKSIEITNKQFELKALLGNFIEKAAQRGDLRAAERWLSNAQNAKLEPNGTLATLEPNANAWGEGIFVKPRNRPGNGDI